MYKDGGCTNLKPEINILIKYFQKVLCQHNFFYKSTGITLTTNVPAFIDYYNALLLLSRPFKGEESGHKFELFTICWTYSSFLRLGRGIMMTLLLDVM